MVGSTPKAKASFGANTSTKFVWVDKIPMAKSKVVAPHKALASQGGSTCKFSEAKTMEFATRGGLNSNLSVVKSLETMSYGFVTTDEFRLEDIHTFGGTKVLSSIRKVLFGGPYTRRITTESKAVSKIEGPDDFNAREVAIKFIVATKEIAFRTRNL
ncbi:hypothetical protein CDL15_Pgr012688 [Punica granatum]|uniref:Uncharacterized protein n=1 Tax=Punica granatum TaxID=22663 RepID=A0A218XE29_PUNGR|nr:hypothetical protein CDL15_Pgr012688 [Punica granatum]